MFTYQSTFNLKEKFNALRNQILFTRIIFKDQNSERDVWGGGYLRKFISSVDKMIKKI